MTDLERCLANHNDLTIVWDNTGQSRKRRTFRKRDTATRRRNHRVVLEGLEICVYCLGVATCADHIRPLSRGGRDALVNLAPCCQRCNTAKGTMELLEFLLQT